MFVGYQCQCVLLLKGLLERSGMKSGILFLEMTYCEKGEWGCGVKMFFSRGGGPPVRNLDISYVLRCILVPLNV